MIFPAFRQKKKNPHFLLRIINKSRFFFSFNTKTCAFLGKNSKVCFLLLCLLRLWLRWLSQPNGNLLSRWKAWNSMGRYFWLRIDLHSFTLTFLPWILKSIVQNDLVHRWTTERFVLWQTHVVLSDLWVICPPFHLNMPGFAWMPSDSRGMWMHFTQRPLRLTTFHFFFFTQSRLLSPSLLSEYAVKWRACQGAWSVHRCPAVYWGREGGSAEEWASRDWIIWILENDLQIFNLQR